MEERSLFDGWIWSGGDDVVTKCEVAYDQVSDAFCNFTVTTG
jgi:hypothetical protein